MSVPLILLTYLMSALSMILLVRLTNVGDKAKQHVFEKYGYNETIAWMAEFVIAAYCLLPVVNSLMFVNCSINLIKGTRPWKTFMRFISRSWSYAANRFIVR